MTKTLVAILLTGLMFVAGVSAREASSGRPEAIGTVDAVDIAAKTITLDGKTYSITHDTRWLGLAPGETPGTVAPQLVKHRLGYKTQYVEPNKAVVTDIWVLQ